MSPELSNAAAGASEVKAFVDQLAREYFLDGPDRRAEPRLRVTMPVSVAPLTEEMIPLGYRVRGVTRDISEHGIGLVCQDPVAAKYIMLKLASPQVAEIEVIAEVLRCRPVGYYFDVGCGFYYPDQQLSSSDNFETP